MTPAMRRVLLAFAACLLCGCVRSSVPLAPDSWHNRQVRLALHFFPDNTDQCGPSALASVLAYWGRPAEPEILKKEIYRDSLRGSLTVDLLLAAESRGLNAEMLEGGLDRVKNELEAGHPVIAFVNSGFSFFPVGHYLVLTGYDDRRQSVFAHSGLKRDQEISYRKFEKQWGKTERWALLILPRL